MSQSKRWKISRNANQVRDRDLASYFLGDKDPESVTWRGGLISPTEITESFCPFVRQHDNFLAPQHKVYLHISAAVANYGPLLFSLEQLHLVLNM